MHCRHHCQRIKRKVDGIKMGKTECKFLRINNELKLFSSNVLTVPYYHT